MQEIKFTTPKQYLFGLLFSIKVKENQYRPKYISRFLICPNLNDPQTFKSSGCKKISSVYVTDGTCFDEYFIANWKTLFFLKVYRDCEIFLTAILLFSLKHVFCTRSVFYAVSTITVQKLLQLTLFMITFFIIFIV